MCNGYTNQADDDNPSLSHLSEELKKKVTLVGGYILCGIVFHCMAGRSDGVLLEINMVTPVYSMQDRRWGLLCEVSRPSKYDGFGGQHDLNS